LERSAPLPRDNLGCRIGVDLTATINDSVDHREAIALLKARTNGPSPKQGGCA
jgi:hypothetical protein